MPLVIILLVAGLLQAFPQQVRKRFDGDPNQPLRRVTAIRISDDGEIRAISEGSLYVYAQGRWQAPVPANETWAAELAPAPAGLPVLPATASAKQADGSLWAQVAPLLGAPPLRAAEADDPALQRLFAVQRKAVDQEREALAMEQGWAAQVDARLARAAQ